MGCSEFGERSGRTHKIRSVSVIGGFLDGLDIQLDEQLNCLIGPRGAGKTTVLEIIRYAFDLLPEDNESRKRILGLVAKNVNGGRVRVAVETADGLNYIVSRSSDEPPVVLDSNGNPTDITLARNRLFGIDVFSQNEVERIADDPNFQLTLLDGFEAESIHGLNTHLQKTLSALSSNARECEEVQKAIGGITEELATLSGVEARLKEIRTGGEGDAAKIDEAHERKAHRDREARALNAAGTFLTAYASEVESISGKFPSRCASFFDKDTLSGENSAVLQEAKEQLACCGQEIDGHIESIKRLMLSAQSVVTKQHELLVRTHKAQNEAFNELIAQHKEAMGQSAERTRLEMRRNDLLAKKKLFDEKSALLNKHASDRDSLLNQLRDLRQERYRIRSGIAQRITEQVGPTVVVEVEQCGDFTEYQTLIESSLKGKASVLHKQVAAKLAARITPTDFTRAIRNGDVDLLVDRGELNREQAKKVIDALSGTSTLYQFETVETGDKPSIRLLDGGDYKDSLDLSTGQKCTCILPILLLDSDKPLLVDQPEDNLDNRFVFNTVVKRIREVKKTRQLVFITHNPNIPVLGMAEKVFVLASTGTHAEVQHSGPVDICRDQIVTLLEGGQEAFMERKNRYGF